ncbi:hypothetical protein K443DRAFT_412480 [Laccaria amethystina LaAM-08-1]|uniref:Uncharacterized protein n=1 Tax=Laccaria amethystina LaAM-08-1 TaxID=1095629 RepID=A0A0C9Y3E9_9AGAR|nr:hypothetical protein K443DRAFT_412480 [Laccaria amethystina LaAM-08-1]
MYNLMPMIGSIHYFYKQDIEVSSRDYDNGHNTQWFGQFNTLRCYLSGFQKSASQCSGRTDRPNFIVCFKSSVQNYKDVQCCLARNRRSGSVRLGQRRL